MKENAETPEGLARIWRYELLPLLEEHYFGRLTREDVRERFGLEALDRTVARAHSNRHGGPAGLNVPPDASADLGAEVAQADSEPEA